MAVRAQKEKQADVTPQKSRAGVRKESISVEPYQLNVNQQETQPTTRHEKNGGLKTVHESKRGSIEFYRISGDQSVTPKPNADARSLFNNVDKSRAAKVDMHKTATALTYGRIDRVNSI